MPDFAGTAIAIIIVNSNAVVTNSLFMAVKVYIGQTCPKIFFLLHQVAQELVQFLVEPFKKCMVEDEGIVIDEI